MSRTKIEWATHTWNPLRARRESDGKPGWHCEKVSAGCASCYAETFNGRRLPGGGTGLAYTKRSRAQVETYLDEKVLVEPLRWRKPRLVFVCSMTDLFGEWVLDEQIDRMFAVMALASSSTFMVLTKRAERALTYLTADRGGGRDTRDRIGERCGDDHGWTETEPSDEPFGWPLPNVWLGVSCEDQATADERIPHLLATPAAVRFVSAEPLLGEIDLVRWERGLDWLIVGGESGPGARPCDVAWVRSLVEQCREAGVAPFVKQLGAHPVHYPVKAHRVEGGRLDGLAFTSQCVFDPDVHPEQLKLRDRKGGDPSEWPADLRAREMPR